MRRVQLELRVLRVLRAQLELQVRLVLQVLLVLRARLEPQMPLGLQVLLELQALLELLVLQVQRALQAQRLQVRQE